ncbi:MAG: SIMPL domain-containing protein [Zoogloeaceae bacterium]|jgi:hypothetical protein|nr:SIMPL domain-containing protein [Zoogloeaceae bacterium]
MENGFSRALIILGVVLALGLGASAFILGGKFRTIGDNNQKILVKGLAETLVSADLAEWSVGVRVQADTFSETLAQLRKARPALDEFLEKQGFASAVRMEGSEQVTPNFVEEQDGNGRYRRVQAGYVGRQGIRVRSDDLQKIAAAHREIIQLVAEGKSVEYGAPDYLIQDMESVKMSLIGAATENARLRAEEFAKVGKVKVGPMRSASQGAFYILPADSDADSDDYGGAYDKTTIAKKARVVVTILYGIE